MTDPFVINLLLDTECVSTVNTIVTNAIALLDRERGSEFNDSLQNGLVDKILRDKECLYDDICNYSNKEYKEVFKMSRELVMKLIDYLKEKYAGDISRMIIPFEKRVHILLYTLGCSESFNNISKFFGVPKTSICVIFRDMCKLVEECRLDFIKWPNLKEQNAIRSKVKQFPNCVGFIDGCQFHIRSVLKNEENARSNKRVEYSVILQAVCDHTLKFTDIYIGDMGIVSHCEVFRGSPLCEQLDCIITSENHILGDTNYPLKVNLMTPFRRPSIEDQKKYNKSHSRARMLIRTSLGRLKAKFRRLKHMDVKNLDTASVIICAACVLHNFILIHEPDEENIILKYESLNFDTWEGSLNARNKRDYICRYINGNISV